MKIIKSAGVFFLVTLLLLASACSSGKSYDSIITNSEPGSYSQNDGGYTENYSDGESGQVADYASSDTDPNAIVGTGETSVSAMNKILEERKIIRNANITLEVEDFEKSYAKIEYFISNIGFIQESRINKEKHYINFEEILITKGVIIIRVDASKFNTVLKDVKGLGLLTEENIKSDDVTDKFFDVESRLRLVRYQESRLEEYLKKIDDPDTIFKTEAQLTNIRHEIETLTGTLNKLSDLVELSTITINMQEIPPALEKPEKEEEPSYLSELKETFLNSFEGVLDFCAAFIMGIVAVLPALFLLAIVFAIIFLIYKKIIKKTLKKFNKQNFNSKDKISNSKDKQSNSEDKDSNSNDKQSDISS